MAASPNPATTSIDMLDPMQTCTQLGIDQEALLDLVNTSKISAYDLGGAIRFRAHEVASVAEQFAIAA